MIHPFGIFIFRLLVLVNFCLSCVLPFARDRPSQARKLTSLSFLRQQFQHPETLSWLPIKATVPSIDDVPPEFDEDDEDDLVEVVDEDEDAPIPSSAKGKGRG
jgi:hypothetical protein